LTPVRSREDELCLLLARGKLSSEERARTLQFLATPLQWPLILERAYSHQVYPLLYRHLLELGFPGVPHEVQTERKSAYLANGFRNQLLAEELARLLKLLGEAGIPVIPLKGVTLAQSLFGDPAARVCSDIDILVPPGDAVRARGVILRNGYSSQFTEEFFVNHQLRTSPDCPLVSETKVLTHLVELHWTLLYSSSKNQEITENLWSQARPYEFYGVRTWNLTPEWEFVFLALHAASQEARGARYMFTINSRWTIDGSPRWNLARYINHSCRPNAKPVGRNGGIVIVASRRIEPGEEITYDYGREYFDYFFKDDCRCSACCAKKSRSTLCRTEDDLRRLKGGGAFGG